jgi:flagellar hook assembly protein FlgD
VLRLDLAQNAPNPFESETVIRYQLPARSDVSLTIYDTAGRAIRTLVDDQQPAGYQSTIWDGKNSAGQLVGSGVYFCKLNVGNENLTRTMTVLR